MSSPTAPLPKRPRRNWYRLGYFMLAVAFIGLFRSMVADWNDVLSSSMSPTIIPGDRLLVNKSVYDVRLPFTDVVLLKLAEPERGDVVVFNRPEDGLRMIKRVIGLPGDVLSLRRGILSIDGNPATYKPADDLGWKAPAQFGLRSHFATEVVAGQIHPILRTPGAAGPSIFQYTVPDGHVYVLGDNRDNSEDSRIFGPVPFKSIVGKVGRIVISLDHEDRLRPRWDRFCAEIP